MVAFSSLVATRHSQIQWSLERKAICPPRIAMNLANTGRASTYGGAAILAAILTNRLLFTPLDSLALTQSRSDIIGVIAGATLLLYGVGRAEIEDKKEAVELSGVDVRKGFTVDDGLTREVEMASAAILAAVPNIKSFIMLVDGVGKYYVGRFRNQNVNAIVVEDGIIAKAMENSERVYLADMKVVPVKEIEFGFLPSNCQSVIVQPVSKNTAVILGADKARPFTGPDFGWLQAMSDRLLMVIK